MTTMGAPVPVRSVHPRVWVRRALWGLACPDWPLCFGQVVPAQQMDLQVFLEWFHRGTLGLTALTWRWRDQLPRWLPWGMTAALGLVVWQGVLGGLTVTELLRFDIVTAHLGTGLAFFSLLLSLGVALLEGSAGSLPLPAYLPGLSLAATLAVYGQSLLGGLVASRWAAHQCLAGQQLCQVFYAHLLGLLPATLLTLAVGIQAWRQSWASVRWLGQGVLALLVLQILVGWGTYRLRLQIEPLTVTHQAVGALLLGTLVVLTVWTQRLAVTRKPR